MAASAAESAATTMAAIAARHGHRLRSHAAVPGVRTAADGEEQGSVTRVFTMAGLGAVRQVIRQAGHTAGLRDQVLADFVVAAQELMTNAIRYGGGWGRVRLHRQGRRLMCVVTDHGRGLAGHLERLGELPDARSAGGRGLFLARRLTDDLKVISSSVGVTVTVTMNLPCR